MSAESLNFSPSPAVVLLTCVVMLCFSSWTVSPATPGSWVASTLPSAACTVATQ